MVIPKTAEQIPYMERAGALTAKVLEALDKLIRPGISTLEIDTFCEHYIREELRALPGSKGQYDFPFSVNTSVNQVVCHGWPSAQQILKSGDIVNVDVTVLKDGYYGDSSKTFLVGQVSPIAQRLVTVTQQCLYLAIAQVKPGSTLGDIGHTIQQHAQAQGYSVVREYCGHGIGQAMHEAPQVLHYGTPASGLRLQAGMTFTIEPMINQGKKDIKVLQDGWTVVTRDRSLSAQFEHTILVTDTACRVLTMREEEHAAFAQLGLLELCD